MEHFAIDETIYSENNIVFLTSSNENFPVEQSDVLRAKREGRLIESLDANYFGFLQQLNIEASLTSTVHVNAHAFT